MSIRVGEVGLPVVAQILDPAGVPVNVSGADTLTIYLTRPRRGAVLAVTAVPDSDGTDGKIRYMTLGVGSDFDQSGTWLVQGYVSKGGTELSGERAELDVQPSSKYPGQ